MCRPSGGAHTVERGDLIGACAFVDLVTVLSESLAGRARSSGRTPEMVDRVVFVGVDTHADVHHAAVVDELGRWLGDRGFATTPAGYAELWGWAGSFGAIAVAGVEGGGHLVLRCRLEPLSGSSYLRWGMRDTPMR